MLLIRWMCTSTRLVFDVAARSRFRFVEDVLFTLCSDIFLGGSFFTISPTATVAEF